MTTSELARILKDRYDRAPYRDKAAHVVMFGIEFGDELASHSIAEITAMSQIGKWGPQVALGRKLANFVQIKK